jgi:tetratricopeptide (TPR) repeat protein
MKRMNLCNKCRATARALVCLGVLFATGHCLSAQMHGARALEYSRQLFLEGRYQTLIDSLRLAPLDSLTPATLYTIGSTYSILNDIQQSLRYFQAASLREPASVPYRFQVAQKLAEAGLESGAESEYLVLLEKSPDHVPSLIGLGRLWFDRQKFDRSAAAFSKVVRKNPRDFLSNYFLGASLLSLGQTDSAISFLAIAQTLNPNYVPAISMLSAIQFGRKNYTEAARLSRKALLQQPYHADLWYRAGLSHFHLKDYREARNCFLQAVRYDTANSAALAYLGQTYFELKNYDSSRVAFEAATVVDDDNPTLFLNLGLALARLDSVGGAAAAFRAAVDRYGPQNLARAYNELGALYFMKERYRDARDAYRRALDCDPRNAKAAFYLAFTLDQMGKYKSAIPLYRNFISIAARDSSQLRNLSVAKERLKDLEK